MMKFYMTPGSCSTGIHVLLEECGLIFEAHIVDILRGQNHTPEYLALNPRGTIPTLVLDDSRALTDWAEIALYLGQTYPRRRLVPVTSRLKLRAISYISQVVDIIHAEGFTRIFTTRHYRGQGATDEQIQQQGRQIVLRELEEFAPRLAEGPWLFDDFSIADAALFYVEFWAHQIKLTMPDACVRHFRACLRRPAVKQVLMEEGYGSLYVQQTTAQTDIA